MKLTCVNPTNTKLVKGRRYEGKMYRLKSGKLVATTSYDRATYFETKVNNRPLRAHVLRFLP